MPGDAARCAFTLLFSESAARAVVAVRPGSEAAFAALLGRHGVPAAILGTTGGAALEVNASEEPAALTIPLDELAAVHRATLPALFG